MSSLIVRFCKRCKTVKPKAGPYASAAKFICEDCLTKEERGD